MSLRFRLTVLVCALLLISLGLGGAIAYSNARHAVRKEMGAALAVGRRTIETALAGLGDRADPSADLGRLVASFDGDRHLRVWREGRPMPSERANAARAPRWFVDLIGISPKGAEIPVVIAGRNYGALRVETDPYNETVEVWDEFTAGLVAPALFCGLTVLLIYVFIGRMLRPLDRLTQALAEIGEGDYRTRLGGALPPELARLRDSFNRMARRLAEADADNRGLHERLVRLQEQERAELARDLHDEVSPFLFAIGIDAAQASRLIADGRGRAAAAHVQSIADAVRHIHRQVRRMLGRLRPIALEQQGLAAAIEDIVAFWRRRRPEIRFESAVSSDCERLPEVTAQTVCRIVQEGVSNAVRHADPANIAITVARTSEVCRQGDLLIVKVADDGCGMAAPQPAGYGLRGIGERVRALGGSVSLQGEPGAGLVLAAVLPCAPAADGAVAPAGAA